MTDTATARPSWLARNDNKIAAAAAIVAVIGALTALWGGIGYQLGMVGLLTALQKLVPWGAYIAIAGAGLSLLALILVLVVHRSQVLSRGWMAVIGIVVGLITAYIPYSVRGNYPPIHDITTDIDNPPAFVDALPVRAAAKAPNTADYVRDWKFRDRTLDVPGLQQKAFPDIKPVMLPGDAKQAFDRALDAAKRQGWHIIAAKPEEGRIEAWDKTTFFGFVDDIVIRITPADSGSKVDVRSNSRIGVGDIGKNAKRIRAYVKTLTATG